MIDFILWFTEEEPQSVFADVRRQSHTGTDQLSGLQIRLANGALAQLMVTQNAPAFLYETHVFGSAGDVGLRIRNLFQPELEVFSSTTSEFGDPGLSGESPASGAAVWRLNLHGAGAAQCRWGRWTLSGFGPIRDSCIVTGLEIKQDDVDALRANGEIMHVRDVRAGRPGGDPAFA